jgi:hypothetical protein
VGRPLRAIDTRSPEALWGNHSIDVRDVAIRSAPFGELVILADWLASASRQLRHHCYIRYDDAIEHHAAPRPSRSCWEHPVGLHIRQG